MCITKTIIQIKQTITYLFVFWLIVTHFLFELWVVEFPGKIFDYIVNVVATLSTFYFHFDDFNYDIKHKFKKILSLIISLHFGRLGSWKAIDDTSGTKKNFFSYFQ